MCVWGGLASGVKTEMCRALLTSFVAWCMVYGVITLTPRASISKEQYDKGCGLSDENKVPGPCETFGSNSG